MLTQNRFLQGVYPFDGAGLDKPAPLSAELSYVVPDGVVAQALYFRGGNTTDELVIVVLMRDGVPMRYFPIGAKCDVHVPLRVVEDIEGGSVVELQLSAPLGAQRHRGRRPRDGGALMTATIAPPKGLGPRARRPPSAGGDRQRHGRGPRGRGDPGPRRRRAVQDHHVRRRAVRQLQPDHAEPRAVRRGAPRRDLPQLLRVVRRERHRPACRRSGSTGSTGSPTWCSPTTARSPRTTS